MSSLNPKCQGGKCSYEADNDTIKLLPLCDGETVVRVCRICYQHEMRWRKERNQYLPEDKQFNIPLWTDLQTYEV